MVRGGTSREVKVELGLFAEGRVEVSGGGLSEGMKVGVPKISSTGTAADPAPRPRTVVALAGVTKEYPGPVAALRGVDLTVEEGELLGIVGPSGSGKSTLLHIIGTLDRPTEGSVHIAGHDRWRRSRPQALRAARPARGLRLPGVPPGAGRQRARQRGGGPRSTRASPARCAAARPPRRWPGSASRTASTTSPTSCPAARSSGSPSPRAVVGEPALLLADEPTGALDSASGAAVMELLRDLNREGATIAVITHDTEIAARLPREVRIRDGQVVADVAHGTAATTGAAL
ncbi:peptide ABC transporter ATP-binding protein [Streptomyces badius]